MQQAAMLAVQASRTRAWSQPRPRPKRTPKRHVRFALFTRFAWRAPARGQTVTGWNQMASAAPQAPGAAVAPRRARRPKGVSR